MEKAIRNVVAYAGLVLCAVCLFCIFGTIGAIECNNTDYAPRIPELIGYLAVMFVGAVLTNVKERVKE